MTVTLNIPPEVEAELLAEAESVGIPLDLLISRHLESLAQPSASLDTVRGQVVLKEQLTEELDEWLDSFPSSPVLSEEALKRENWYTDRW